MREMKRIAIVENPRGGWSRGIVLGLANYAATMENWELRQFSPRPGVAHRVFAWKPDAIVSDLIDSETRKTFAKCGIPVINTGVPESAPHRPGVFIDHAAIGQMAAKYFADRGFRQVVFLNASNHPWWRKVETGLRKTCRRLDLRLQTVTLHGATSKGRRSELNGWLRSNHSQLAVCTDPELAGDLAAVCRHLKRAVPEEVAILATEDHEIDCQLCVPPLSGIRLAGEQAGQLCGQWLSGVLRGVCHHRHVHLAPDDITERHSTSVTAIQDALVRRAVRMMQERAGSRLSVKEILQELVISRRTLENRFQTALGRSPLKMIHAIRMDRVRRAIVETDQPIQIIASHFGYRDIQQFSREFRRLTNDSATNYRQSCRHANRS